MRYTRYPELSGWFKEGLFQRRQIGGELWTAGHQAWYVNKLREKFFAANGERCVWNVGNVGRGADVPFVEKCGWIRAKIKNGFNKIENKDMRLPMMTMILTSVQPLPKAHDIANECGFAWEQFKYEFSKGLYDMYKAKEGIYV